MELILQSKQDNYSGIEVIKDKCPILSEAIMDYIIETNAINGIENLLTLIDTDKITEELIKIWDSVHDILTANPNWKRHNIYAACSGEKPSIYGYKWKKIKNEDIVQTSEKFEE